MNTRYQFSIRTLCWKSIPVLLVISGATLATSGCATLGDKSPWPWKKKPDAKELALTRPAKLVSIWSESVVYGPNQQPTRGLGGRIYFYNQNHKVVPVDGELVVYAFDDDVETDDDVPQRKYVFSAEQFAQHFSESEFGPSYSIWIPWDRVGGSQQSVSLMPIFKTTDGQLLVGDHSRNLLKGKKKKEQDSPTGLAENEPDESSVQQASFNQPELRRLGRLEPQNTAADQRARLNTPIPLSPSMRQRIIQQRDKLYANRAQANLSPGINRTAKVSSPTEIPSLTPRSPSIDQPLPRLQARAAQVGQPIRGRQRLPRYRATSPFDRPIRPELFRNETRREYSNALEHSPSPNSETSADSETRQSVSFGS